MVGDVSVVRIRFLEKVLEVSVDVKGMEPPLHGRKSAKVVQTGTLCGRRTLSLTAYC